MQQQITGAGFPPPITTGMIVTNGQQTQIVLPHYGMSDEDVARAIVTGLAKYWGKQNWDVAPRLIAALQKYPTKADTLSAHFKSLELSEDEACQIIAAIKDRVK